MQSPFAPRRRRVARRSPWLSHDGIAHARHDRFHVGEVAVDDPRNGDDVGDALHALAQDVVGDTEGFEEARVLSDRQQLLVGDDDRGVHRIHQFGNAALRLLHAALAFESEGLGDHRNRKGAHFAGQRGDDGSSSGSGAAAEAGSDEYHVGAFQGLDDLVGVLERRFAPDFRVGAGASPLVSFTPS